MPAKLTLNSFIEKSNNIHDFKYNYSKVVYKTNNEHVIIICPIVLLSSSLGLQLLNCSSEHSIISGSPPNQANLNSSIAFADPLGSLSLLIVIV